MGQFDRFIDGDKNPPPSAMRVFAVVATVAMIIRAVGSHRLEDILVAALFLALLLPLWFAPDAYRARLDRHLVVGTMFSLCGLFVFLAPFLNRHTRLYIGVPAAVVLTALGVVRKQARLRAAE